MSISLRQIKMMIAALLLCAALPVPAIASGGGGSSGGGGGGSCEGGSGNSEEQTCAQKGNACEEKARCKSAECVKDCNTNPSIPVHKKGDCRSGCYKDFKAKKKECKVEERKCEEDKK